MACQTSRGLRYHDIGSEQDPKLCCAVEGGLSEPEDHSRSPKTQMRPYSQQCWIECPGKTCAAARAWHGMQCQCTWYVVAPPVHPSMLQVRRNERLLASVVVSPHERRHSPQDASAQAGASGTHNLSRTASSAPLACTRDAPLML